MNRKLKVCDKFNSFTNKRTAAILLSGKWLIDAGFPINENVIITSYEPGKLTIELQSNIKEIKFSYS